MANGDISRRQLVSGLVGAGMTVVSAVAQAQERYKLGVMAGLYASVPLDDALARVRKAGYRYISIASKHGDDVVFAPEMSKADRKAMLRRIRSAGVEPFLSLGGFAGDPQKPEGLQKWIEQIDLCADFAIPIMVGGGPWYFTRFPNLPKRERDWAEEVTRFYAGLEKAVRHAESAKVIVALKPHTGITARAKDCIDVVRRLQSPHLKIAWDAGNVSYYEGIYPDPDLPDLAPHVVAVCIKDHSGGRAEHNFPVPGQGQIDHEAMFRTLFQAGFQGPLAIERLDGRAEKLTPAVVDERLAAAHAYLAPLLDRVTQAR